MAKSRWLAPWDESENRPAIYHLVSRVMGGQYLFGEKEKDKFRELMWMSEEFTGCRILSYVVMSDHFHILLEVPSKSALDLSDSEFFHRLGVAYPKHKVQEYKEIVKSGNSVAEKKQLLEAYTYRMHDLSEFMKFLLHRFSSWFNSTHKRRGYLWAQRYTSVLIEAGLAAAAVAAYIDLNPVRAEICEEAEKYPWCSYAEAVAGEKRAQAGLARVCRFLDGDIGPAPTTQAGAREWTKGGLSKIYRIMMEGGTEAETANDSSQPAKKGIKKAAAVKPPLKTVQQKARAIAGVIRERNRYFTAGDVIGSRAYVDEVFRGSRQYFGPKRTTGARKIKGVLAPLSEVIWSARNLRIQE